MKKPTINRVEVTRWEAFRVMRCSRWIWTSALALMFLAGCGGGTGTNSTPPVSKTGTLRGQLGSAAGGADVRLDGTSLSARANADGSFELPDVPPGEYTLSVTKAGGGGAAKLVRVAGGAVTEVGQVTLEPVGQLAGLVHGVANDNSQVPLANARVTARQVWYLEAYAAQADPEVKQGIEETQPAGRQAATQTETPPRVAYTNAAGSFTMTGLTEGPYTLEVSAEGYENGSNGTWVSAGHTTSADVRLRAIDPDNANLSGVVQSNAGGVIAPLAHVMVSLWPVYDGPMPMFGEGDVAGRQEGDAGGGNATPGDVGWAPPGTIDQDPWYMPPWENAKETTTDEQGKYALRNITPGKYVLTFQRYGFRTITRELEFSARQSMAQNANLEYILATVSGTVFGRDTNGVPQPLAGAWVNAYSYSVQPVYEADGTAFSGGSAVPPTEIGQADLPVSNDASMMWPPPNAAVTDANGHYTLQLEAGHATVSAWADGYYGSWSEVDVTAAGRDGVDLLLLPYTGEPGGGVDRPLPADAAGG